MKFTFQTATLIVLISMAHVAVIRQFLPKFTGNHLALDPARAGLIGPQVSGTKEGEVTLPVAGESGAGHPSPEWATLFPESSGSNEIEVEEEKAPAEQATQTPGPVAAKTVLGHIGAAPVAPSQDEDVLTQDEDAVAMIRPDSEKSDQTPPGVAPASSKVRQISPLP